MAVVASPTGDLDAGGEPGTGIPASDPRVPGPRSRRAGWWLAGLAMLAVVLALAIPFAPVVGHDPVVTWPRAGQTASSTALPLTPYRALEITARVPCAALATVASAASAGPGQVVGQGDVGQGDAFRTEPVSAGVPGRGLTVSATTAGGAPRVSVTSAGVPLLDEPLPAGPCLYTVRADAAGTVVDRDATVLARRAGPDVPQVAELATDAPGTPGLGATVHTDDRYSSVPSVLKLVLLIAHALVLLAVLLLAYRRWARAGDRPRTGLVRPRPHPADALVGVVSAAWVLLSPMQNDDSWYLLMARGATPSGFIGNQIYMFNVTENPFVGSQYVMALWGHLGNALGAAGWGLFWMRLLPLLLGLVAYALLRTLLATALGRIERRAAVPWALAVAHLAWWLPYGMALRPEVFIVPLAAAVLVLCELARRREAIGPLVPATALAALAVTASPYGLVAAAPLLVALPWFWRWLVARGWRARLGAAGAIVAAGTIAIPVGFGDATLGDVVEATATHSWYYVTFPWYEEWAHYRTLIETGTWGRRLPVLLTVVLLVVVSIGSGRRGPGGPVRALTLSMAGTTAVALFLLTPGPTKWVNHFGAVAAPATVLLALCLLTSPLPRRPGALVSAAGVALITGAAVLGFAGPNVWKPYSDRGQPFGDHLDTDVSLLDLEHLAPHIGEIYPRQVWWWVILAVLAAAFVAWRRRAHRRTFGITPERSVLALACVGLTVGMVAVMAFAPYRQSPGWTVAAAQWQALTGEQCGLANAVSVMTRTSGATGSLGAPVGPEERTGDFALAADDPAPLPAPGPAPGGPALFHDDAVLPPSATPADPATATGRGSLTTGWYPVPAGTAATTVVVPLAGNDAAAQGVVVEFASGGPNGYTTAVTETVRPAPGLTFRQWQEIPVALPGREAPGALPTAVRLRVDDQVPGADSSLAVAPPALATMMPVTASTAGRAVFADQLSAALWPCVDQVFVRDGIAPTPEVRLSAAENTPDFILTNPTYEAWGGTLVGSERTWAPVRVFSGVTPGGPPTTQWGNVDRLTYDLPTDGYDLHVDDVPRGGLTRFPTLASEEYSGREYLG